MGDVECAVLPEEGRGRCLFLMGQAVGVCFLFRLRLRAVSCSLPLLLLVPSLTHQDPTLQMMLTSALFSF